MHQLYQQFLIEKNVPIPASRRDNQNKYPLALMEIGDSFFMTPEPGQKVSVLQARISATTVYFGKRTSRKFASRSVAGGIRVWWIA